MNPNPSDPNGMLRYRGGIRRWSIPTTVVNEATAKMPEEHCAALRWIHDYGIESDQTVGEIAARLKKKDGTPYSPDSLYQTLTGRRSAGASSIDPIVTSIVELRNSVESRGSVGFPFVHWRISNRIFGLCDMAFTYQDIVFIYGRTHRGKTTPLKTYAANKPFGRVIYVEMPIGGYISAFKTDLAEVLKISGRYSMNELTKRIRNAFDPGMILIVDQFHRAVPKGKRQKTDTLDFIMQLHDMRECGIVLAGTPQAREEIENKAGPNAEFYQQLVNRSVGTFLLNDDTTPADLAPFAQAVGLPPATGEALDLQTSVMTTSSLGKWIKLLRTAMRLASNKSEPLTWQHVIKSNAWLKEQEK